MKKIFILIIPFLFISCSSNLYTYNLQILDNNVSSHETVYVTNPELLREFDILKKSNIYIISQDNNTSNKLTLDKMERYPGCGMLRVGTYITLGILPGYALNTYRYSYSIEDGEKEVKYEFGLEVLSQLSIFETIKKIYKDNNEVLAETPRSNYFKDQANVAVEETKLFETSIRQNAEVDLIMTGDAESPYSLTNNFA